MPITSINHNLSNNKRTNNNNNNNAKSIDAFLRFTGLTSTANQKGNKGYGAARRRLRFVGVLVAASVIVLGVVQLILVPALEHNSHNNGGGGERQLLFTNAASGVMRHARQQLRRVAAATSRQKRRRTRPHHKLTHDEKMELILAGKLNLVEIQTNMEQLAAAPKDSYDGVYGLFCQLNFDVHKKDPSSVPMFRDVVGRSPMCEDDFDPDEIVTDDNYNNNNDVDNSSQDNNHHDNNNDGDLPVTIPRGKIRVNLKELADAARDADANHRHPRAKNLQLTGVVFHESRCGSTLVANALIAMNPAKHRVYSESAPPLAALTLCRQTQHDHDNDEGEGPACSLDQGASILRDVVYFMGRTDRLVEERYFFKIQSAGTHSLSTFRKAFPETPWLFVYRDPVQVMMSHFAHGTKSANCLRSLHRPSRLLQQLARRRGYKAAAAAGPEGGRGRGGGGKRTGHRRGHGGGNGGDDDENDTAAKERTLKELSPPEFCAAHLATLTETAADHIQQSRGLGRAVNYASLPHVLYEQVLPSWGVDVTQQEIENIQAISGKYSKGRGNQKMEWKEDSEKKEEMATPEIQQASKIFLQESFELLEQLSKA